MSQLFTFELQGVQPAFRPELAVRRPVALPYGGPYGTSSGGGAYAKGLAIGLAPGTAQPEKVTLTIGTTTGTVTNYFYADKVYTVSHLYNDTAAVVKAAWEAVFGAGNVGVVYNGTTYVLTLQGAMANRRVGGYLTLSAAGNASWARTQRGNCGAGQYDVYDGSAVTTVDAVLINTTVLNPMGGLATDLSPGNDVPFSPPAWVEGFFNYADISGIATAAVTGKVSWYVGSSGVTTGAVVRIVQ